MRVFNEKAKEYLVKILFCFFLAFCAAEGFAYTQQQVRDMSAQSETLISEGNYETALKTLLDIFPSAQTEDDKTQIQFLIGMASALKGDNATAEWVFRRILKNRPSLTRVRLELALLYFKTGRDTKADYHFRLALGGRDLPPEVKQKIAYFLYQIRYRKKWNGYLDLGITPNSNINNASAAELDCVDFLGVPLCRQLQSKQSSIGISGFGGVENYLRMSHSLRLKTTVTGGASAYPGGEYNIYSVGASSGPLYNFSRGFAGLYGSTTRVWYGGQGLLYDAGPLAEFSYDLSPRVNVGLNGSFKFSTYDNDMYRYLTGSTLFVMPTLSYATSSKSYILLKPSAQFMNTRYEWSDMDSYKMAVGFGIELPLGISLYLEPSYMDSRARGKRIYTLFEPAQRRADATYNIDVRLLYRQINIYGFTPTLNYSYTDVRSNIKNMSYNRNTVELGITNRF
ncbi:MAG: surface lipoprotein assembly modifier [Elusimicrobia bacterium]|nr:surface lipoprotein assembly modifier [Elusimicrobiota bacterium]